MIIGSGSTAAQQPSGGLPLPTVTIGVQQTQSPKELTTALQILLVLTVLLVMKHALGWFDEQLAMLLVALRTH